MGFYAAPSYASPKKKERKKRGRGWGKRDDEGRWTLKDPQALRPGFRGQWGSPAEDRVDSSGTRVQVGIRLPEGGWYS